MSKKSEYYEEKIEWDCSESAAIEYALDNGDAVYCACGCGELVCLDRPDTYKVMGGDEYLIDCCKEAEMEADKAKDEAIGYNGDF